MDSHAETNLFLCKNSYLNLKGWNGRLPFYSRWRKQTWWQHKLQAFGLNKLVENNLRLPPCEVLHAKKINEDKVKINLLRNWKLLSDDCVRVTVLNLLLATGSRRARYLDRSPQVAKKLNIYIPTTREKNNVSWLTLLTELIGICNSTRRQRYFVLRIIDSKVVTLRDKPAYMPSKINFFSRPVSTIVSLFLNSLWILSDA